VTTNKQLYTAEFQNSFLAHLMCDTEFLKVTAKTVEPSLFSNDLSQRTVRLIQAHFEKFQTAPAGMILDVITDWATKGLINEKLSGQLTLYCQTLLELPRQHRHYLLDRYDGFLRSRKLVNTVFKLTELAKKENLEDADALLLEYIRTRRGDSILQNGREGGHFDVDPTQRSLRRAQTEEDTLWMMIPPLDKYRIHMRRGHILMFASQYTGAGKSTALAHIVKSSVAQGKKVLYLVIGEMSKAEVEDRLDQMIAGKTKEDLDSDIKLEKMLFNVFRFGGDLHIECFSAKSATVQDLRDAALEVENTYSFKPDVVVIDYMDNILSHKESLHEKGKEVAIDLKRWAQEDNVFMATALQGTTSGQDEVTADLRHAGESRGKPEQADIYITINRTQKEKEENLIRLYVAKYRHGASAITVTFKCDLARMQFYVAPADGEAEPQNPTKPEPKKGKK
jgi:KaiC/GvpD/RAD55 family RecA-like ATPase